MAQPGLKVLICGTANSGKTRALKTLDPKTTLVINIDGKSFGLPIPHKNFASFPDIESFIFGYTDGDGVQQPGIVSAMESFKDKLGTYPKTVVLDTISRVYSIIGDNCETKYKNFDIHTNKSKEVAKINNFLQTQLVDNGINLVLLSHVHWDSESSIWKDSSTGAFAKTGGVLSTFDNAVFFEAKNKKYTVTTRGPGLPCRTLLAESELPTLYKADDYSLAEHLAKLEATNSEISDFIL